MCAGERRGVNTGHWISRLHPLQGQSPESGGHRDAQVVQKLSIGTENVPVRRLPVGSLAHPRQPAGQERTPLDETFEERADCFASTFERLTTPTSAFGFRITAMPKDGSLDIDAVMDRASHLVEGLEQQDITITRHDDENPSERVAGLEDTHSVPQHGWQPRLGFARSESEER